MAKAFKAADKEKQRYIVFKKGEKDFLDAYQHLFGIQGMAEAGIQKIKEENDKVIIRVDHKATDRAKAAIAWSGARSLVTSGTLKKAKLEL